MDAVGAAEGLARRVIASGDVDGGNWLVTCLRTNYTDPACANGYYGYPLDLAANASFVALFGLSALAYAATYAATRRGAAFTAALLLGLACEVLGYAGRVVSWRDPWDEGGFLLQVCCLAMAPAFMAAGIYLCLRRVVCVFGAENSRIPPDYYARIFIPCDVLSLLLQAAGGATASVALHRGRPVTTGDHIMIAGLAFQVVTMAAFMLLGGDFALSVRRRRARPDAAAAAATARGSRRLRGFLAALAAATACIFARCCFRVAELGAGWTGPLMRRQGMFVGFEGAMVLAAAAALNVFHPSLCLPEAAGGEGRWGRGAPGKSARASEAEKGLSPP